MLLFSWSYWKVQLCLGSYCCYVCTKSSDKVQESVNRTNCYDKAYENIICSKCNDMVEKNKYTRCTECSSNVYMCTRCTKCSNKVAKNVFTSCVIYVGPI